MARQAKRKRSRGDLLGRKASVLPLERRADALRLCRLARNGTSASLCDSRWCSVSRDDDASGDFEMVPDTVVAVIDGRVERGGHCRDRVMRYRCGGTQMLWRTLNDVAEDCLAQWFRIALQDRSRTGAL